MMAMVHPSELADAVRHLLVNALVYTPESGHIEVRVSRDGGAIMVQVRDNGIGIAPDQQAHIFELFYRVDQARPLDTGGVGIGLSIVKMVAEAHGGSVSVESALGEGSTFTLRVPC